MALFRQTFSRLGQQQAWSAAAFNRANSTSTDLRTVLTEKIPVVQEEVKAFRKQHGNTKVNLIDH